MTTIRIFVALLALLASFGWTIFALVVLQDVALEAIGVDLLHSGAGSGLVGVAQQLLSAVAAFVLAGVLFKVGEGLVSGE